MAVNNNRNGLYCEICGKPLTGQQKVFCSKQCTQISYSWGMSQRKRSLIKIENGKPVWEFECKHCGKKFITDRGHELLCKECASGKRHRKYALSKERKCIVCGKPLPSGCHHYCSPECRKLQKSLDLCTDPERSIKVIDGKPHLVTTCRACGKEFVVGSRTRYCSEECATQGNRNNGRNRQVKLKREQMSCHSYSIARY